MIPVRAYSGRKVAVFGLGRSGLTAAAALHAGGAEVVAWDDNPAGREAAADQGVALADLERAREWDGIAALILSPGIPHLYPRPHDVVAMAQSRGVPVDNDVGLFFSALLAADEQDFEDGVAPKVIAVTGSNGKSTTSALIHHILLDAGRSAQLGGNIGRGVLGLDPPSADDVMVLELSSYQIELARILAPDVAVFTNLSPDHLDRHGGIGGYFAAKRRLFEQGGPERSIIGVDEKEGRYLAGIMPGVLPISVSDRLRGDGWSVFMNKAHLTEWRGGKQIAALDLRAAPALVGVHNHQNACAAYAACRAVGIAPRQIEPALASFAGLAHRMERLGTIRGVPIINDSKATNADAAEKALLSYPRIRWIAGGVPKAGGIDTLQSHFDRIARAYLIGEAAGAFSETLGTTPHTVCGDLESATIQALDDAEEGDVVLLSPACASFDQFDSFEARGDAFRAIVARSLREETS